MTRVGEVGEAHLVARLRAVLDRPRPDLLLPNGDDAACWQAHGPVAATVDSVVAGVDWLPGRTPARAIGHRAAAVNLSDLAAVGAQPRALLLALELPPDQDLDELLAAAEGLAALADRFGCSVVGGDVGLSSGPARWTVTALGDLVGPPLRRDAARPGDRLWLVGEVGLAGLGLDLLRQNLSHPATAPLVERHLWPIPRVEAGLRLARAGVRLAALDVSDGLGLDAQRLAQASGVALALEVPAEAGPDPAARQACEDLAHRTGAGLDWRAAMASGGDDYALLVAAPPELDVAAWLAADPDAPKSPETHCWPVGRVLAGPPGTVTLQIAGQPVAGGGWLHQRSQGT